MITPHKTAVNEEEAASREGGKKGAGDPRSSFQILGRNRHMEGTIVTGASKQENSHHANSPSRRG